MASVRGFSPDVSEWPLQRPIFVAETEEEAREIPREGVRWMWEMIDFISHNKHLSDIHQDFQGWRKNNPSEVSYDEFLEKKAIFGTPETVAAKIKWLRDTYNIQHLIGDFSAADVMLGHSCFMSNRFGCVGEELTHLRAYVGRIEARPCFQKAINA